MSEELPYDLARLTWDLLENRKFRRETLLQYAVTSRVDQLRLLFFASSSVVAAVFPWFARELVPDLVSDVGISSVVLSAAASAAFAALALGEKSNRGKKLVRLERELALGELSVWQPDSPIGARSKPQLLASLRGKRRLIACCAAPSRLLTVARAAAVYRRRFEQSGVVLVLVLAADGGGTGVSNEWSQMARAGQAAGWLWLPTDLARWRAYFAELLSESASSSRGGIVSTADQLLSSDGAWLALSLRGRSVGSALGSPPWDELLGTCLPPLRPLLPSEPSEAGQSPSEKAVLQAVSCLYKALASADADGVARLCAAEDDAEVTELSRMAVSIYDLDSMLMKPTSSPIHDR